MDRASQLVSDGLAELGRGTQADRTLDRLLRRNRDLSSAERALVARRFLGIACLRGRLAFRLDQACPGWPAAPAPHLLAAYVLLEEGGPVEEAAAASGLAVDSLTPLGAPPRWPTDPVHRLAAAESLPRWLAERWLADFGEEGATALAQVSSRPGPLALRANTLKTTREALAQALAGEGVVTTPAPLSPWGLILQGRANVFGLTAWRDGLFEVQDEGSQQIARAVGARPGERVLDLCAGAGGKTLALAAAMEDRGEILALDVDAPRLINLSARLRRAGVGIVQTRRIAPEGPLAGLGRFDRVVVDAPCSSLGTLRRSPDLRWRLQPEAIPEFARVGLSILTRGAEHLRAGGLLVYATCTLTHEENEGVARDFLARHPGWTRRPLLGADPLVLLPHVHGTDGFFACGFGAPG